LCKIFWQRSVVISPSAGQWLPYGLPGFNFQTFYVLPTEDLFVSTWILKQTVLSSPHGINWFLFFPLE